MRALTSNIANLALPSSQTSSAHRSAAVEGTGAQLKMRPARTRFGQREDQLSTEWELQLDDDKALCAEVSLRRL